MSSDERRKYKRVATKIPAAIYSVQNPKEIYDAVISNLSEGGAFVRCSLFVRVGEEIIVEIHFAGTRIMNAVVLAPEVLEQDEKMLAPSVVRWASEKDKPGFGVEFSGITQEQRVFLQTVVDYFEQINKND